MKNIKILTILMVLILIIILKTNIFSSNIWNVFFNHKSQTIQPILMGNNIYISLKTLTKIFPGLKVSIDRKNNIIGIKYNKFSQIPSKNEPLTIDKVEKIAILPFKNEITKKTQKSIIYPGGPQNLTKLFKDKLFNTNSFIVIPNNITNYNYSRKAVQDIAKKLKVDAIIIGKLTRYEYRTDTSGRWASPLVEAKGEILMVEVNQGKIIWYMNLHKFDTNFTAFNSGSKRRRLKLLNNILNDFASDSVYNLIEFKKINQ